MPTKDLILHAMWGVILLLFSFILTNISSSISELSKEFYSFRYTVSSSYTQKDDILRIEDKVDKLYNFIYNEHSKGYKR